MSSSTPHVTGRVLFVSNGHGEEAIAARIARDVRELATVTCDHLAVVGEFGHPSVMRDVGPRRTMPSGGLIAMGNVKNIVRDVGAGLIGHTLAQLRFLRSVRGTYDVSVAVGDVFGLALALQTGAPAVYVGTAKSVYVAPYGPMEERLIRKAGAIFVRDAATAQRLREHGVRAEAPGNVIVDLYSEGEHERIDEAIRGFAPVLGLFPGSRPPAAYSDALFLCAVVRRFAVASPHAGAVLSIAPGLDVSRLARALGDAGWHVVERTDPATPFALLDGEREVIRAWRGGIGPIIEHAALVLGQAGTANEAAAAGGVPVMAFEVSGEKKTAWYRMRQSGLLGGALLVGPGDVDSGAVVVQQLLDDAPRRVAMGAIGRERMGPPGGARAIAQRIVQLIEARN
ncbi:MAG: hypothetical protein ACXVAG_01330 [Vulcanimicrobiaceae bacterium]